MVNASQRVILLVEDNMDDADLALLALTESRVQNAIVHVQDGAEALDYLFIRGKYATRDPKAVPQVVLLDLKLPKIDGLEVLQKIRANPFTRATPVVILTTSREDEDLLKGYNAGANSYIQKPVDFSKFTEAVKQMSLYWLVLNEAPPTPPEKA